MSDTTFTEYTLPLNREGTRRATVKVPDDLDLGEYGRLQGFLRAVAFGPESRPDPEEDSDAEVF